MILCSNPGCQTTAGCICDRVGRSPKNALAGTQRCRKPGCGANVTTGHPCTDYDCPERFVTAVEYQALEKAQAATISQLQAEIARYREALKRGARLALSTENFCHRFTMNDLAEMDDQQRNAVLDQIKLFREGARAALGGSND